MRQSNLVLALIGIFLLLPACASRPRIGDESPRRGDEIVVAGRFFHTGAPVVLWTDPGGYDAYRTERRFAPWEEASFAKSSGSINSPERFGLRRAGLDDAQLERVRGGGWTLEEVQDKVDQFVIHYDVCGTSRTCFRVLHDVRGLSVHFMLDIDGTIYQTLDVKERAWHAGPANDRSVGIEIANIGAYPPGENGAIPPTLKEWYGKDEQGTRITLPARLGDGGVRTPDFIGRPVGGEPVVGMLHGGQLMQYDLTPEQYASLIKLTAALAAALPNMELTYPKDENGMVLTRAMSAEEQKDFRGLIGHFHLTDGKIDPGPAFRWQYVTDEAKKLLKRRPRVD